MEKITVYKSLKIPGNFGREFSNWLISGNPIPVPGIPFPFPAVGIVVPMRTGAVISHTSLVDLDT